MSLSSHLEVSGRHQVDCPIGGRSSPGSLANQAVVDMHRTPWDGTSPWLDGIPILPSTSMRCAPQRGGKFSLEWLSFAFGRLCVPPTLWAATHMANVHRVLTKDDRPKIDHHLRWTWCGYQFQVAVTPNILYPRSHQRFSCPYSLWFQCDIVTRLIPQ